MSQGSRKVKRFSDLEVWRRSHDLFLRVFKDIQQVPPKRGADVLCNQVIRSIGSIGANIAEGFNRSKKRYLNSLDIALGEAAEAKNWLYKLRDTELMEKGKANGHVLKVIEIQKMLHGLIQSIETCEDGSRGPG